MADELENKIINVLSRWGRDLVNDMKAEIDRVVTHNGGQASKLSGSVNYKVINKGGVISYQLTMNRYWEVVEKGRGANKKAPPSKAIKEFIKQTEELTSNIDNILLSISIKHKGISKRKRKGAITGRGLKGMAFDKKLNSLSFMIARSIGKKGIKAKPFYDNVINDERINELKELLAPVMKEYFILEIKKAIDLNGINFSR